MQKGLVEDWQAKCPYYLNEKAKGEVVIRCAGGIGRTTVNIFNNSRDRAAHKHNFCQTMCYQGCPIFQIINEAQTDIE